LSETRVGVAAAAARPAVGASGARIVVVAAVARRPSRIRGAAVAPVARMRAGTFAGVVTTTRSSGAAAA
jgi:hypothetical protein